MYFSEKKMSGNMFLGKFAKSVACSKLGYKKNLDQNSKTLKLEGRCQPASNLTK